MFDQLREGSDSFSNGVAARGRTAATVALAMFASFALIVTLLHVLRPDTPPLEATISDYATGAFGFLMTTAFLAWALGMGALLVAISKGLPRKLKSWFGLILLAISSVSMVLVAVFPGDPLGAALTSTRAMHDLASVIFFLTLMISMLVISVKLRRAGVLSGGYAALLWLSIGAPPLFVVALMVLDVAGLIGLGQRIFVIVLIGWLIMLANGIRNRSFRGASEANAAQAKSA